jgi:predicted DNA-binding protein
MKKAHERFGNPTSVRFSKAVETALIQASEATGIDKQDIIRLACAIGLRELKEIDFDLAKSVHDAAKRMRGGRDLS